MTHQNIDIFNKMEKQEPQLFIGGIPKFTKDMDFAKFLNKTIPDVQDLVYGISKRQNATGLVIHCNSDEAKILF